MALCGRYGFAYYGDWAQALIGWARGQERPAEGVELIESGLDRLDAQRAQARRPYYLSLLAETYSLLGNRDRAASILDAAITMALERADVWWLPALYLQKSELEPPPERERDASPGARAGPRAKQPGPGASDSRVVQCESDLSRAIPTTLRRTQLRRTLSRTFGERWPS